MTSKETPRKEYFEWKNVDHCCLCGSSNNSDRFTNIFSVVGKRKDLASKIKVALNVNVCCGEGSLKICRICERKLNSFNDFISTSKSVLESVRERGTSKRCLNFSPQVSGKRANICDSDENDENNAISDKVLPFQTFLFAPSKLPYSIY